MPKTNEEKNYIRGEEHYCAKLTEENVIEIRRLVNELDLCCTCVRKLLKLECSNHAIWEAASGITWKHLP